ncbi:MAG: SPOR domain-containing protein [Maritimibacter sp.]|nr:SPOR domain-containing protein [Maritimibacter sp.]
MKFPTLLGVAALVAALGTSAMALSLSQAATPAETPPAGYAKDVYVDSRGCVYVRASIGTSVNWVPRLSRDRETVVCGMTPTASVRGAAATPPAPPAPRPPTAMAPAPALAAARPAAMTEPDPVIGSPVSVAGGVGGVSRTLEVNCPADGGVTRVKIGGDTVAVSCPRGMSRTTSYVVTHADGSRSRLVAHPASAGAAGTAFGSGYGLTASAPPYDPVPVPGYVAAPARRIEVPAGYKPAWDDDRLNPNRGPRTPYGDAQMSSVLDTSKVPMPAAEPAPVRIVARTVIGSKGQPDAAASTVAAVTAGARFVQVGAFGQPGNADRAIARLRGLGFTAATARTGSGLTLVMAGPFASPAELTRALQTLRGYYPDAYPRG